MKIKIMRESLRSDLEQAYNDFQKENKVFFTQSHFGKGGVTGVDNEYILFVYYEPKTKESD